ncbi:MAG TPA: hypothetical protein VIZ70_03785 [Propionibacteriaceae bacterium]
MTTGFVGVLRQPRQDVSLFDHGEKLSPATSRLVYNSWSGVSTQRQWVGGSRRCPHGKEFDLPARFDKPAYELLPDHADR